MLQRTNKLLIGKDISRTAAVTSATSFATVVANIKDGELVVLDKYKVPLTAGDTIDDSDVIFICQGTSETFDYTNEAGTVVTGARKCIFSDPIDGTRINNVTASSYVAKSEQTDSYVLTGTVTVGVEYLVRIIYKDMVEHPGQFTQTYRVVSTGATVDSLGAQLAAAINAHKGRRVNATYTSGTDTLLLTGRAISECTTSVNDIDEFSMVEFKSLINYVDSDGNWATFAATLTSTPAEYGLGTWEQVRDIEKKALGYKGVQNLTAFPVIKPAVDTVKSATYDIIVIEHEKSYLSPDNQYKKEAPLTTVIAIQVPSAGTQETTLLAQLNPWLASCPKAFPTISV